ncbi:MAG: hypothetical protein ACYSUS_09070 [Planctomycetota bacterium]
MMFRKKKKVNPRRQQVRDNIATERFSRLKAVINSPFWDPDRLYPCNHSGHGTGDSTR